MEGASENGDPIPMFCQKLNYHGALSLAGEGIESQPTNLTAIIKLNI
jgi:hypothetical protein